VAQQCLHLHGVWGHWGSDRDAHESNSERLNSARQQRDVHLAGGHGHRHQLLDRCRQFYGREPATISREKLPTSTTSVTVKNLPLNGSEVYVTLYSLVNGVWLNNRYNFNALSAKQLRGHHHFADGGFHSRGVHPTVQLDSSRRSRLRRCGYGVLA
jgi:hypothetical protein